MDVTPLVFVINLAHRHDRRSEMQKQLSRVGWDATFFPAVRPDSAADFPSVGARGCFLSHLAVLKHARDAGLREFVILEDDVDFAPKFQDHWHSMMAQLKANEWSICYPGHVLESLPPGLTRIPASKGVRCTHFMLINGSALPSLIAGLETILSRPAGHPLGGPMHVDGAYSTIRAQQPALATFVHCPVLGHQRPSRTDVGRVKWFDRIGMIAPMINFARRLKGVKSQHIGHR